MAKRKNLKKAISYLSGELLDELFVKALFTNEEKEADDKKMGELVGRILSESESLRNRISIRIRDDRKADRKAYRKAVKAHFASIRADWDKLVGEVWNEIEAL